MKSTARASVRGLLAVVAAGVSSASAEDGKAYRPIPAQTGKAVVPPAGLLETAKALRDAAAAKNAEAVFALLADDVTFVATGITLEVPRRVEKKSYASSGEALEAIGLAYTEGEPDSPAGETVDRKTARIATALSTVVASIDGARWGRDPLVVGAYCTSPGAKWEAGQATKAGIGGARGAFVTTETRARAAADPKAKEVATLRPGEIYVSSGSAGDDGWSPVTLPSGKAGWAPPKAVHGAQGWAICFLPDGRGGWLWSAVISALL